MVVGINRLYLIFNNKYAILVGYFYTVIITGLTMYVILSNNMTSATYIVFRNTVVIEFALLSFNSMVLYKNTFKKFVEKMEMFDTMLNIKNHRQLDSFTLIHLFMYIFIFAILFILDLLYILNFDNEIHDKHVNYAYLAMNFAFICHDTEIIFFCVLLTMILRRVKIIKGHVRKLFLRGKNSSNKLEGLSYNANLDVSHLHNAYDLLHTCSEKLNSAMNFPFVKYLVTYTIVYCMKFTIFFIMPCYCSNITTTQAATIRTMLHDAINTKALGKYERRKLKAFFQLTQDSEFAYALWGVIKMDMSLPLSYCSLCVTYLIIVVQFSRFID
ncbi:uncharacterized protein LOC123708314 [Pieris brassicae]|uniref:uncharacterized protein LOC123708314 n=1 Tax=Pieris brassicae TaxID=7116 RepID=UPI001E65E42C|nr:uncharacterized protein LOC123708314 [Pieris brassicae]